MTRSESGDAPGVRAGVIPALQRVAGTFVALAATRAELAATELEELRERYRQLVVVAVAAAMFLALALLLLTLLVVVAFWDTHRVAAIFGLLVIYLGVGLALGRRARRLVAAMPSPFEATIAELRQDAHRFRRAPETDRQ